MELGTTCPTSTPPAAPIPRSPGCAATTPEGGHAGAPRRPLLLRPASTLSKRPGDDLPREVRPHQRPRARHAPRIAGRGTTTASACSSTPARDLPGLDPMTQLHEPRAGTSAPASSRPGQIERMGTQWCAPSAPNLHRARSVRCAMTANVRLLTTAVVLAALGTCLGRRAVRGRGALLDALAAAARRLRAAPRAEPRPPPSPRSGAAGGASAAASASWCRSPITSVHDAYLAGAGQPEPDDLEHAPPARSRVAFRPPVLNRAFRGHQPPSRSCRPAPKRGVSTPGERRRRRANSRPRRRLAALVRDARARSSRRRSTSFLFRLADNLAAAPDSKKIFPEFPGETDGILMDWDYLPYDRPAMQPGPRCADPAPATPKATCWCNLVRPLVRARAHLRALARRRARRRPCRPECAQITDYVLDTARPTVCRKREVDRCPHDG